ncbi:MAG: hypothetical protein JWO38_2228 [Gemmataceae bacterium]|nr:hypothetical protein [Gemmataceae bacterium]
MAIMAITTMTSNRVEAHRFPILRHFAILRFLAFRHRFGCTLGPANTILRPRRRGRVSGPDPTLVGAGCLYGRDVRRPT